MTAWDDIRSRTELVERLRGTKHTIQEAFYDMREGAERIVALEAEVDRLVRDVEDEHGPVVARYERKLRVQAERIAGLEAVSEAKRAAFYANEAYWHDRFEEEHAALTVAHAQLGNAVGAIIDSGGYCEGPHDVADAVYRLTEERDSLRAAARVWVVQWAKDYEGHPPVAVFRTEAEAEAWMAPLNAEYVAYWATEAPLAVGGAPGVPETHTDPKEAP